MRIEDLPTPALLLDKERLHSNIEGMAKKIREFGVALRPHIKTHKCINIAEIQREKGAEGITVSSLFEAKKFAEAGFRDISYAVPLTPNKIQLVNEIREKTKLTVLLDSSIIVQKLDNKQEETKEKLPVMVKIDCGYHRSGVDPTAPEAIHLVKKIDQSKNLKFEGIMTHAGHSYYATSLHEIQQIAIQEQQIMIDFAQRLKKEDANLYPEVISIGSTPTIAVTDEIKEGITEVRPGNYVFYDYTQGDLGTCDFVDCALTVASSVLSSFPTRLVLDAGATTLSKDLGPTQINQGEYYGQVIDDYESMSFSDSIRITSLSQEHGKCLLVRKDLVPEAGEMLRILPNHSCLTANLFDYYYVVEKENVVDRWKIQRGHFTIPIE
ncbi:MAG: D-threo-3-hydroxyaspartate dehydratase [Candidatus Thorarchaeota archaeon]|nr:MAG: D-threo-3-hydroxyaspartate dehydratase [Candidatus Thorarchaeota archaeon]